MTEEEANISQVIEDACGCPLRELPADSDWWEVYDELIEEQKLNKTMKTNSADSITGTSTADGTCRPALDITTTTLSMYHPPRQVDAREVGESIEFIYKEIASLSFSSFPPSYPPDKVFKIIFSCVNGKWHKSDRIYGKIIAASDETYEFD